MVKFEAFKGGADIWQAVRIATEITSDEYKWLHEARPEVTYRNRNRLAAGKYIARALKDPELTTGALYVGDRVVGLGTIAIEYAFAHPNGEGKLGGRLVDYWTRQNVAPAEHAEAVRSMATYGDYDGPVVAAMTERELERAPGIPMVMMQIGEPGKVRVLGPDRFQLEQIEEPLQLFAMEVQNQA